MKAARIHAFDGRIHIDDVDAPVAGPGEAVVRLTAVAVNPLDLWVVEGSVAGGSQRLPFVLGLEGVGAVDGRRVIVNGGGLGTVRDGLLREAAAVPLEAVVDVPRGVDDTQAAALSVAGTTAKRIVDLSALAPGAVVVVLGASGGVGSIAIQVAKSVGARVVAVTRSPEKRAWLEQLGPDLVIAGPDEDVVQGLSAAFGHLADVVLNPLGADYVASAVAMLAPGGRQILFGRSAGDLATFSAAGLYRKNLSVLGYGGLDDDPELKRAARTWVFEQIAAGDLAIPVRELPLARTGDAFDLLRGGKVQGKVVIRVSEG